MKTPYLIKKMHRDKNLLHMGEKKLFSGKSWSNLVITHVSLSSMLYAKHRYSTNV